MAYGDFKELAKRTAVDQLLSDKAFNNAKDSEYDKYQRRLDSMIYKFFDKKTASSGIKYMPQNEQLAEELHKPIKKKVHSTFKDNVSGADLADMQIISKTNKRFRFLFCVIDIFTKHFWVVPLKDKKRYKHC